MEIVDYQNQDRHEANISSPSLRSFPLDATSQLPPISHAPKSIAVAQPLGSNPYPNFRHATDFGSIGSIGELSAAAITDNRSNQEDSTQSFSLTVCKQCQDALLGAFDHCLSKHGEPLSTHYIDEEADGKILVEPPSFDIIKDPTLSLQKKPAFDDPKEKIERDRWVQQQSKLRAARLDITTPKIKGLGVKCGKSFSGAIYKRMLEAKDREINQLRAHLYDTARKEFLESENVKKLKKALNQSVHYYTFAEEWQQNESSRLQQDVRHLKSEMSSLMAFLINSEVEKQLLLGEMKDLKSTIAVREKDAENAMKQAEEVKVKLQESFKEFIAMDETIKKLRKEAVKGSEAVELRNNMLQKNLTKLTADFEVLNRDFKMSTNKTRELEYELEQMVIDINIKGDALFKSNTVATSLKESLDNTKIELSELQQNHEQLILAKAKVEADGRAGISKVEQQCQELQKKIDKITSDLDRMTQMKSDADFIVKTQKAEIEKLKSKIVDLTGERDNLSILIEESQNYARREISKRDDTISELQSKNSKQESQIKTISDRREQLIFEVTDLQNALEIESTNAIRYLDDLTITKKLLEEKTITLTDQIEKLTASKHVLNTDKKELTEKIKSLRAQMKHNQDETEAMNKDWEEKFANQKDILGTTNNELTKLRSEHKALREQFTLLTAEHRKTVSDNISMRSQKESMIKKQSDTDAELDVSRSTVVSLVKEKTGLQWDLANSKSLYDQLLEKYNTEVNFHLLANEAYAKYKERTDEIIADREIEIERHLEELIKLRRQNRVFANSKFELENTISELQDELKITEKDYKMETRTREILENQLNENRLVYLNEKRMRAEIERVSMKLKYIESFRESSHLDYWKTRDRKLDQITQGLTDESKRLTQLVNLLPSDEKGGFGNEKDFKWPSDVPFLKNKSE